MFYVKNDQEMIDRLVLSGFSYNWAVALFYYLEECQGEELVQFDVVGIRCDFVEYKNEKEARKDLGYKEDEEIEIVVKGDGFIIVFD